MYKYCFFLLSLLLTACMSSTNRNTTATSANGSNNDNKLKTYDMALSANFKIINIGVERYLLINAPIEDYSISLKLFKDYEQNVPAWQGQNLSAKPCVFAPNYKFIALHELTSMGDTPWVLWVKLTNTLTNYVVTDMLTINPMQANAQNLLLVEAETGNIYPEKYIQKGKAFTFYKDKNEGGDFLVHYYTNKLPTSLPAHSKNALPFSPIQAEKTTTTVPNKGAYIFDEVGTYFIQSTKEPNQGLFVYCVDGDFPKITTLDELVEAMRYITKNEEYERLMNSDNQKVELDNFWLKVANNNTEKAKLLLRTYFKRVELANYYFTAEKEGWRTDRGIVYIVFGAPTMVKKTAKAENWYYKLYNGSTLHYHFSRMGELYTLSRESNYMPIWNEYIQRWRSGQLNAE